LLAQVAGRAGRGRKSGRVILQTYNPTHFTIQAARMQDFRSFYQKEIEFRKALKYPPFTRMVQIRISGAEKAVVEASALSLARRCKALESQDGYRQYIDVLGPIEAPLARVARQYRWQILVKSPRVSRLHAFVRQLVFEDTDSSPSRKARISVDVDPFAMM
ncbi:MAG: primosomal protein N', partial [Desulfobacterales bacterium]|nr:primosomal protein N' [Desulfobacterales bacterium]